MDHSHIQSIQRKKKTRKTTSIKKLLLFQMATVSYFLLFMLMIQGITIFSNNIPMVEASRGLVYSENLTPPPGPSPSNSSKKLERKLQRKFGISPPPSPTANVPNKDSATNHD